MDEFVSNRDRNQGDDPPVTAVASRRVKPGHEREFEEWVRGILLAANAFPGYLGSEVLRPSDDPDDDEYKIVFRFDHASNALQAHADPWLGYTEIEGVGFVVSELSPYVEDIDWADLTEPEQMAPVLDYLGRATAKVHCVADEDSDPRRFSDRG